MADERRRWLDQVWAKARSKSPERKDDFRTTSDIELEPVDAPANPDADYLRRLGFPGEYPFTRGVQPTMYRGRSLDDAPVRGLRQRRGRQRALPLPAQVGADGPLGRLRPPDADGPRRGPPARARRGGQGRACRIGSLRDMEVLLKGIPLGEVSTSMTINSTAAILLCALRRGGRAAAACRWSKLSGTVQNDILKEYIARGTYMYPPAPSLRLMTDVFAFCAKRVPQLEPDQHQRVPHPRGGLDGGAGDRLHPRRRHRLRGGRSTRGSRGRRVRGAAVVLLQRPQQLPRGDRQVPRRAPAVGPDHEGALQGEGPALHDAALPRADRGLDAHRAAAREQRRARGAAGDGGGAGRRPVAAHQQQGRGAGASRPRQLRSWRCARSRSSPTRPAWRTSSIRSAAATRWSG